MSLAFIVFLTCFHASFFPFYPFYWPPLLLSFSRHFFALFSPTKSALFCRAEGAPQSLERDGFRTDLSADFGKEIPSRNLRKKRSVFFRPQIGGIHIDLLLLAVLAAKTHENHKRARILVFPGRTRFGSIMVWGRTVQAVPVFGSGSSSAKSQGKKKHININKFAGLSRDSGGCQKFVYAFFSGHSLWGRKTHKQNSPQNPGTIP